LGPHRLHYSNYAIFLFPNILMQMKKHEQYRLAFWTRRQGNEEGEL
jgi:hypothetical protein